MEAERYVEVKVSTHAARERAKSKAREKAIATSKAIAAAKKHRAEHPYQPPQEGDVDPLDGVLD